MIFIDLIEVLLNLILICTVFTLSTEVNNIIALFNFVCILFILSSFLFINNYTIIPLSILFIYISLLLLLFILNGLLSSFIPSLAIHPLNLVFILFIHRY